MEIFDPHSNINFLRWRKISITISALLVILSILAITVRGLNYGLDFTGGVLIEASYQKPVDTGEVRGALSAGGFENAVAQSLARTLHVALPLQPHAPRGQVQQTDQLTGLKRAPAEGGAAPLAGV